MPVKIQCCSAFQESIPGLATMVYHQVLRGRENWRDVERETEDAFARNKVVKPAWARTVQVGGRGGLQACAWAHHGNHVAWPCMAMQPNCRGRLSQVSAPLESLSVIT
jgi:hypothetical protein